MYNPRRSPSRHTSLELKHKASVVAKSGPRKKVRRKVPATPESCSRIPAKRTSSHDASRTALQSPTKPSPPLQRYRTLIRKSNPRFPLMFPASALRSSLFTLSGTTTTPFFSRPCVGTSFGGARSSSVVRAMGSVPGDFTKPREVARKLLSQAQPEGDGATVRRSIGRWVGGSV